MKQARLGWLALGMVMALPLSAARLDFIFAYDFASRAEGKPAVGAALTLTSTLQKAGEPLGSTVSHAGMTYKGKDVQTFAVAVEVEGAEDADAVVHTLAYVSESGTPLSWRAMQKLLPVPYASRAKIAAQAHQGKFSVLKEEGKVTATDVSVETALLGISNSRADLTADTLALNGGLSIQTPTADVSADPSLATQSLHAIGAITLTGTGNTYAAGKNSGLGQVPPGTIIAWPYADRTPGSDWVLCNGQNGTPNLQGLFPIAAKVKIGNGDSAYDEHDTGGAETVALKAEELPSHFHSVRVYVPVTRTYHYNSVRLDSGGSQWGRGTASEGLSSTNTGSSKAHNNLPPYYSVHFYMKAR